MKNSYKVFAITLILAICVSACDKATEMRTENDTKEFYTYHDLKNTDIITIDYSYFDEKKGIKKIYYDANEYRGYGIPLLNPLGMAEKFVSDDADISFSIVSEIELYDNIQSLVIRGDAEYSLGIWLVNYDSNHKYIDSYPVGYDEWLESADWITSVIYTSPTPHIEQLSVSWEDKENSRIEILQSGKFKITQAILSKYEM